MSSMPNKDVRAQAHDVVRTHLGRIIMLTLAAVGAPLLLIYVSIFAGLGPILGVQDVSRMSASVAAEVYSSIGTTIVLALVCVAVSAMISVGYTRGIQLLASGVKVKAGVLISRSRHVLGCVGLPLWIGVKTMVWYIPGMLIQSLGAILAQTSSPVLGMVINFAGSITTLVMVIPASLRYGMAMQVFAENPEIGVYDAVERSKAIMAHRKWQLFCLMVPYWLIAIAVVIVFALLMFLVSLAFMGYIGLWLATIFPLVLIPALGYLALLANVATACYYNAHKE